MYKIRCGVYASLSLLLPKAPFACMQEFLSSVGDLPWFLAEAILGEETIPVAADGEPVLVSSRLVNPSGKKCILNSIVFELCQKCAPTPNEFYDSIRNAFASFNPLSE